MKTNPTARHRIVVTGMGLCTPIGSTLSEFAANLKNGKTGIAKHDGIFKDRHAWAAMVDDFQPEKHFSEAELAMFDRTAQMGILAARQAIDDSGAPKADSSRQALVFGTSHGGRSQLDRFVESGNDLESPGAAERILEKSAHYHQAAAIASKLGIHGPCLTLSNACSSSGAAIAYGIELLRSGKCDWVIAGGADGFSKLTYAGFEALGAMADGPCAPFSDPIGMSLGDGAGFIILERHEDAVNRNAKIHAELYGWGSSWDAYHITAPEPSGDGMLRAIEMAVSDAGISKNSIDYINIHGTGTRANDAAEAVGLRRYFEDSESGKVPPLSATKSLTGHMLGASSSLGVIASIVGMQESWLPPTANFTTVRPGCELDAVPNVARDSDIRFFIAQSAAFAGANAVVVGGKPGQSAVAPIVEDDDIVISGVGVVSPIGCDIKSFYEAAQSGRSGISSTDDCEYIDMKGHTCGMLKNYAPRKLMPALNLRRVDRVSSFATIAASLALKDAGLFPLADEGKRTGLVVAITRGAATSYEKYLESVAGEKWKDASAVYFPNLVMSSVGGQVTSSLGIRGITSSLVGGGSAGLQALTHAIELFRRNAQQDSVVVVASDELASLYFKLYAKRGLLKGHSTENSVVLGEGAVAFVLEKKKQVQARNHAWYGRILGYGLTHEAAMLGSVATPGGWMLNAAQQALASAGLSNDQIDQVHLLASGRKTVDCREKCTAEQLFPKCAHSLNSITPLTGFAEASSSLANMAAMLLDLHHSNSNDPQRTPRRGIVLSGSDDGSNAAVILEKEVTGQ